MRADTNELKIDLGEARDQGPRPTCLSFSLSEIHRAMLRIPELLSPESLHRAATLRAQKPLAAAITVAEAVEGLAIDGQTTEFSWPYNINRPVVNECTYYRAHSESQSFSENLVSMALAAGCPLSLVIDIDISFFTCDGAKSIALSRGSQIQGRHAIVICGWRSKLGRAEYLIKNSWGESWGDQGYAWLTSEYILARSPELVRI